MSCQCGKKELELTVYHNARCSKSRSACEILADRGVKTRIVNYLETPLDKEALRALLKKLGMQPSELVRRGEAVFKENYAGKTLDEEQWLAALAAHPILIERPIVARGHRAVVGRPPEKVLELLETQ